MDFNRRIPKAFLLRRRLQNKRFESFPGLGFHQSDTEKRRVAGGRPPWRDRGLPFWETINHNLPPFTGLGFRRAEVISENDSRHPFQGTHGGTLWASGPRKRSPAGDSRITRSPRPRPLQKVPRRETSFLACAWKLVQALSSK